MGTRGRRGALPRSGITDHAQELLGDLVFVELPEVGSEARCRRRSVPSSESVKAASDVFSPLTGEVIGGQRGRWPMRRDDQPGCVRGWLDLPHPHGRPGRTGWADGRRQLRRAFRNPTRRPAAVAHRWPALHLITHIPAAVWQIAPVVKVLQRLYCRVPGRRPARARCSCCYEYQSMMMPLMAMDVSNAVAVRRCLGLAEAALLMAVRQPQVEVAPRPVAPLHPCLPQNGRAIVVSNQNIELVELPDAATGHRSRCARHAGEVSPPLVIPAPNFSGLEDVDALTDFPHANGMLAMAWSIRWRCRRQTAGRMGRRGQQGGADIARGDGQPLARRCRPGGPYFGFRSVLPGRTPCAADAGMHHRVDRGPGRQDRVRADATGA